MMKPKTLKTKKWKRLRRIKEEKSFLPCSKKRKSILLDKKEKKETRKKSKQTEEEKENGFPTLEQEQHNSLKEKITECFECRTCLSAKPDVMRWPGCHPSHLICFDCLWKYLYEPVEKRMEMSLRMLHFADHDSTWVHAANQQLWNWPSIHRLQGDEWEVSFREVRLKDLEKTCPTCRQNPLTWFHNVHLEKFEVNVHASILLETIQEEDKKEKKNVSMVSQTVLVFRPGG